MLSFLFMYLWIIILAGLYVGWTMKIFYSKVGITWHEWFREHGITWVIFNITLLFFASATYCVWMTGG